METVCSSAGCDRPATLACPTCISLGVKPPSRFCSQECFTANWIEHTEVHKALKKLRKDQTRLPPEFRNYAFSGALRPCMQSARRTVPPHIDRPDYASDPRGVSRLEELDKRNKDVIKVYSAEEIAGIRAACRIGREVLDVASRAVAVGVTCDEIDRIVHEETIRRDAYPSPLNYYEFPKSVCTSVNEVICHGIPDFTELRDGDIVNIDISVYFRGFHGDLNETLLVGAVDADTKRLVRCAYESLAGAVDMVRPGTLYRDLGARITAVTEAAGCSVVTTYCGHGIGQLFHTNPNVPHYAKNKAKGAMEVGHVFTIEPMVNLGVSADVLWPDNWTAVTKDGSRSAQFEHTMVVTATGCELLTGRVGEATDRLADWSDDMFQR